MDDQIHKVFKWTSCEKLYARPKNGGYGLLEMRTQLLGHRAAVLLSTLGEESDWYTKYMRLKLIHHMAKITARDRRTHISRAKGLNCSDFLLDSSGRFFNKFDWTFTRSEKFYLQAWLKVARRTRNVAPIVLPEETVIEQTYEAPDGGEHGFSLTPNELKACEKKNFQSLSKTKQEALPPVMPGRFTEICPEVKRRRRWEKFWKQLHKFEWKKHLNLQAIHRFNFGSHVPFHDTKRPIRDHKCLLCLQEVNSTQRLFHLYTECGETLKVWELLGIQTPMKLESMLAPLTNTYEELRNLNWYVDTVRRVYLSRRQEQSRGVPLRVLTGRQLKMALARSKASTS